MTKKLVFVALVITMLVGFAVPAFAVKSPTVTTSQHGNEVTITVSDESGEFTKTVTFEKNKTVIYDIVGYGVEIEYNGSKVKSTKVVSVPDAITNEDRDPETQEPEQGAQTQEPEQGAQTQEPEQGTQTKEPEQGIQTEAPELGTEAQEPENGNQELINTENNKEEATTPPIGAPVYLGGDGSSFNAAGWQNVFYLGGSENEQNPSIWHLVIAPPKDSINVTYMKLTFTNGNVFIWDPSMGFSVNGGGNNPGWVIIAPYDWEIAYNNKKESGSYLLSTGGVNNFNISGYHKGTPTKVEFFGNIELEKLVLDDNNKAINIKTWITGNIPCANVPGFDMAAYLKSLLSFNLYSVTHDGQDVADGKLIKNASPNANGMILFTGLADGWYAIEETLTKEGEKIFKQADVMYILIANGVQIGGATDFDYDALYKVGYAYNGFSLGYPGLNGGGEIWPIWIENAGIKYPSFCANAGSTTFAGVNGCSGYMVAEKIDREDATYADFAKAYNYIEAKYGKLDDNRHITQIVTWTLLGAIDVKSDSFAKMNETAEIKNAVVDVLDNYKTYSGKGDIIDVVFMTCDIKTHSYLTCQPQLVPIYGGSGFINKLATPAVGSLDVSVNISEKHEEFKYYKKWAQDYFKKWAQDYYKVWARDYFKIYAQDYYKVLAQDYYKIWEQDFYKVWEQDFYKVWEQDYYKVWAQDYYKEFAQDYFKEFAQDYYIKWAQDYHKVWVQDYYKIWAQDYSIKWAQDYRKQFIPTFEKKIKQTPCSTYTSCRKNNTVPGGTFGNCMTYLKIDVDTARTKGYTFGMASPNLSNSYLGFDYHIKIVGDQLILSFDNRLIKTPAVTAKVYNSAPSKYDNSGCVSLGNGETLKIKMPSGCGNTVYLYTHFDGSLSYCDTDKYEFKCWAEQTPGAKFNSGKPYQVGKINIGDKYVKEIVNSGCARLEGTANIGDKYKIEEVKSGCAYLVRTVDSGDKYQVGNDKKTGCVYQVGDNIPTGNARFIRNVDTGAARLVGSVNYGKARLVGKADFGEAYQVGDVVKTGCVYQVGKDIMTGDKYQVGENVAIGKPYQVGKNIPTGKPYQVGGDIEVPNSRKLVSGEYTGQLHLTIAGPDFNFNEDINNGFNTSFTDLKPGVYTYQLTGDGISTQSGSVTVIANENASINLIDEVLGAEKGTYSSCNDQSTSGKYLCELDKTIPGKYLEKYDVINPGKHLTELDRTELGKHLKQLDKTILGNYLQEKDVINIGNYLKCYDKTNPGNYLQDKDIINPGKYQMCLDKTIPGKHLEEKDVIKPGKYLCKLDVTIAGKYLQEKDVITCGKYLKDKDVTKLGTYLKCLDKTVDGVHRAEQDVTVEGKYQSMCDVYLGTTNPDHPDSIRYGIYNPTRG